MAVVQAVLETIYSPHEPMVDLLMHRLEVRPQICALTRTSGKSSTAVRAKISFLNLHRVYSVVTSTTSLSLH